MFEKMVSFLPKDFNYQAYPNVNLFIGHLILQSELKADRLIQEVKALSEKIRDSLAATEKEKSIVAQLRKYQLLKKLFALELTPGEYEEIIKFETRNSNDETNPNALKRQKPDVLSLDRSNLKFVSDFGFRYSDLKESTFYLRPSTLIKQFEKLNQDKRVWDIKLTHLPEIDLLFDKALEFYRWAKKRDGIMLENVEKRLKETGKTKAVVITGGFHSAPFQASLTDRGYNYALISPKISAASNQKAYVNSILESYW